MLVCHLLFTRIDLLAEMPNVILYTWFDFPTLMTYMYLVWWNINIRRTIVLAPA